MAPPEQHGADVVVDSFVAASSRPVLSRRRRALHAQAAELLEAGYPVAWLAARAAEMPERGWTDLVAHCERSRVPLPGQAGPGGRERCPDHPARYRKGCIDCAMAVPA